MHQFCDIEICIRYSAWTVKVEGTGFSTVGGMSSLTNLSSVEGAGFSTQGYEFSD